MYKNDDNFVSIPQLAKLLGISRIAVFKKVKQGQIKAIRIGRNYAISRKHLEHILGYDLDNKHKKQIEKAMKKVVDEYGETLELLGNG